MPRLPVPAGGELAFGHGVYQLQKPRADLGSRAPEGRPAIVRLRARVDPDTGGGNRLRATAHSRGIPITPYTPAARDGSNLDLSWATSVIADGCEYLHTHGHHPDLVAASS